MPRHAGTWPRSVRGSARPEPENTHFLAAPCRCDEKWRERERKRWTKRAKKGLCECKTVLKTAADHVEQIEVVFVFGGPACLTWRPFDNQKMDIWFHLSFFNTSSVLLSFAPPRGVQRKWHICRLSERLWLCVYFSSPVHFSNKHILLPLILYFILLTSISSDWAVWNEYVHIAITAHPLPASSLLPPFSVNSLVPILHMERVKGTFCLVSQPDPVRKAWIFHPPLFFIRSQSDSLSLWLTQEHPPTHLYPTFYK